MCSKEPRKLGGIGKNTFSAAATSASVIGSLLQTLGEHAFDQPQEPGDRIDERGFGIRIIDRLNEL